MRRSGPRPRFGGVGLPAWRVLGPAWSVRPLPELVATDAFGGVVSVADELDPTNVLRYHEQATGADRPLIASGLPAGVPCLSGDGVSEFLDGAATIGATVGNAMGGGAVTAYLLGEFRSHIGGNVHHGAGTSNTTYLGDNATVLNIRRSSSINGSAIADGQGFWNRYRYDGVLLEQADSLGASGAGAVGPSVSAGSTLLTRLPGPGPFTNVLVAWALGFARLLTAVEMIAVEADLAAYGGL